MRMPPYSPCARRLLAAAALLCLAWFLLRAVAEMRRVPDSPSIAHGFLGPPLHCFGNLYIPRRRGLSVFDWRRQEEQPIRVPGRLSAVFLAGDVPVALTASNAYAIRPGGLGSFDFPRNHARARLRDVRAWMDQFVIGDGHALYVFDERRVMTRELPAGTRWAIAGEHLAVSEGRVVRLFTARDAAPVSLAVGCDRSRLVGRHDGIAAICGDRIHAYDVSGELLWTHLLDGSGSTSILGSSSANLLLLHCERISECDIQALDFRSGRERWRRSGAFFGSQLRSHAELALLTLVELRFPLFVWKELIVAVDASTGVERWRTAALHSRLTVGESCHDDVLVPVLSSTGLLELEIRSGKFLGPVSVAGRAL